MKRFVVAAYNLADGELKQEEVFAETVFDAVIKAFDFEFKEYVEYLKDEGEPLEFEYLDEMLHNSDVYVSVLEVE